MCEPCNVLQSGPRFDFLQLFFSFSEPMQVVIAPAVQFPMDLCSASAIQPISFLFCCKSKLFNSKENCKSNPRFPLLLFTLSNTQTHKLHYRSTSLSGSSAKLQCCRSRETPCQPSGSTRCPLNMTQVRKGNLPESTNITSILFSNYISTKGNATTIVGKPHWQSLL